jgi:hypothetical protein
MDPSGLPIKILCSINGVFFFFFFLLILFRFQTQYIYLINQVASIIFIDAPVGAGFSYAKTSEGYYTSDTKSALQTYTFLRKV